MPISNLVATVAPVRTLKAGNQQAVASGFFYSHDDKLYFVTNRHVVIDEEEDYFPDEVVLRLHTNPNDLCENDDLTVRLYGDEELPLWLEHPVGRKAVDVVALPLDTEKTTSRFFVKGWGIRHHVPQDVDIAIGEDLLVLGYPLGFYDTLHNLPIVRNAVMASVYPVPFEGKPIVLIDSRLHGGTSGSPVLTKSTNIVRRTDGSTTLSSAAATYLVGVHSATLDILGRDPKQDEPLGLNVVWFARLISEIILQSTDIASDVGRTS